MNNFSIVDTHCHIHYDPLIHDVDNVIARAEENNVKYMVCVSCDINDYKRINPIVHKGNIYQSMGIHPLSAIKYSKNEILSYLSSDVCEKLVAIGETGLDDFREPFTHHQVDSFVEHIKCALSRDLPIIMHSRCSPNGSKVEAESKAIIRGSKVKGIAHCFGGSQDFADFLLSEGWYISFAGNMTYKKSQDLRDIAKNTPLDRILIETDAPYLAPEGYRGQTNEPCHVAHVLAKIAEIKNMSQEEVGAQLFENSKKVFGFI